MNKYIELKNKHREEFNNFPIEFAFTTEQDIKAMEKFGLTKEDIDNGVDIEKICMVSVNGGLIRKTDIKAFNEMNRRHKQDEKEAIQKDLTGEGYIKDMFEYELANYEYGYTMKLDDTLEALGITIEEINNNDNLRNGLNLALKRYIRESI